MSNEEGVSLIESLLVIVVVFSIVFLLASLPNALNLINKSKHLSLATKIASKQIEDKRDIKYRDLINGTSTIEDPRLRELPEGLGTIEIGPCEPAICTNEEQVKQVNIQVSWQDSSKTQTVTLETLISKGGLN